MSATESTSGNNSPQEEIKPSKKSPKKKKLGAIIKSFFDSIWDELPEPAGKLKKTIQKMIRTIIASSQKFTRDECLMRGTSVGYNIVVSFVPTLIVVLLVGARFINIDEYFQLAKEFVRKNGIPIDITPYLDVIKNLLGNASTIGGVGLLVMLFSATSVLRNIEISLNRIWRNDRKRPFIQKISGFIMVLIFGPALLTIGISMAQSLLGQFASPALLNIKNVKGSSVIVGDKHVLIEKTKSGNWKFRSMLSKIDFESQRAPMVVQQDENRILAGDELEPLKNKLIKTEKSNLKTIAFKDIARWGDNWMIVTSDGNLVTSPNKGENWYVQKFLVRKSVSKSFVMNAHFNRILMLSTRRGIIIGNGGLVLMTEDSGKSWNPVSTKDFSEDLFDVAKLSNDKILIVGSGFSGLISDDGAKSFVRVQGLANIRDEDNSNLASITLKGNEVWVCGQAGTLLRSRDGGSTWRRKEIGLKTYDFNDILFTSSQKGVLVGAEGKIRYTRDGGNTWVAADSHTNENLQAAIYNISEKKIYIVGDSYHILANTSADFSNFKIIQKSPFWRMMVTALGNFILPFAVIWVLFFLIYKIIPFTVVPSKAASIGAAVTSVLWVFFLLIFKYYVAVSAKGTTGAIYGALAVIPISLLLIYVSSIIMLFGAEVAYFVQFPAMMKMSKKKRDTEQTKTQIWYGFKILYNLFFNFESGKGESKESNLMKIVNNDSEEFLFIMNKFEKRGYITQTQNGNWLPSMSAKLILLKDLLDDLDRTDYSINEYSEKNNFMKEVKKYFKEIQDNRLKIVSNTSLADILKLSPR